jgi:hypothetical protein
MHRTLGCIAHTLAIMSSTMLVLTISVTYERPSRSTHRGKYCEA